VKVHWRSLDDEPGQNAGLDDDGSADEADEDEHAGDDQVPESLHDHGQGERA
jgi:hypothetical protein